MKRYISIITVLTIVLTTVMSNTAFAVDTTDTDYVSNTDVYVVDNTDVYETEMMCPDTEWEEVVYDYFEFNSTPEILYNEDVNEVVDNNEYPYEEVIYDYFEFEDAPEILYNEADDIVNSAIDDNSTDSYTQDTNIYTPEPPEITYNYTTEFDNTVDSDSDSDNVNEDNNIEDNVIIEEITADDYNNYFPINNPSFNGLCVINIVYNYDTITVTFNDGSYGIIGNGIYKFQPKVMGNYCYTFDYDMSCHPVNDFIGCVLTYAENMYGNSIDYIPDGYGADVKYMLFSEGELDEYNKVIGVFEEMRIGAEG